MTTRQNTETSQLLIIESMQDIDISQYLFEYQKTQNLPKHQLGKQSSVHKNQSKHELSEHGIQMTPIIQNPYNTVGLNNNDLNMLNQSLRLSMSQYDDNDSSERNRKDSSKNKIYAKNYRQKKKQKLKSLEEENRFLKNKIDDLSFRLKETQLELNRLKHDHSSNTSNFQTTRESLLKEIQDIIQMQESANMQKLLEIEKRIKSLNAFDSKHKMDLLNYFMSELLQNLINDFAVYFIDTLIERKGIWKNYDSREASRIDRQIAELIGQTEFKRMTMTIKDFPQISLNLFKNFKSLWKKLYDDYVNIINQGLAIETMCRTVDQVKYHSICKEEALNYLKLELYFEKIKYRKDMRKLRESWFYHGDQDQKSQFHQKIDIAKKIKLHIQ